MLRKTLLAALLVSLISACSTGSHETSHESTQAPVESSDESTPAALTPGVLDEEWARSWWIPRHEQKLAASREQEVDLLFLGDSITQGWENAGAEVWDDYYAERNAFNLGFSGDRTENVLWRLQHGEVAAIEPEVVVLMIGTNNTGHRQDPAEETAAGVEAIVTELNQRLPEAEILLLAIFPRGATPDDPLRQLNREINQQLELLAAKHNSVNFLDINHVFLDDQGHLPERIMPDMLHPNARGYRLWAKAMEPKLQELLSKD